MEQNNNNNSENGSNNSESRGDDANEKKVSTKSYNTSGTNDDSVNNKRSDNSDTSVTSQKVIDTSVISVNSKNEDNSNKKKGCTHYYYKERMSKKTRKLIKVNDDNDITNLKNLLSNDNLDKNGNFVVEDDVVKYKYPKATFRRTKTTVYCSDNGNLEGTTDK